MCFVGDSVSPAWKSAAEAGNFLLAGELAVKDGLVGFGRALHPLHCGANPPKSFKCFVAGPVIEELAKWVRGFRA